MRENIDTKLCWMAVGCLCSSYLICWPFRSVLGVNHEQHVRESGPEISPISVVVSAGNIGYFLPNSWKINLNLP